MTPYLLAKNILNLLEKNNKNINDLSEVLNLSPRYLKSKLYKMLKAKDESFPFNFFIETLKYLDVKIGDFKF